MSQKIGLYPFSASFLKVFAKNFNITVYIFRVILSFHTFFFQKFHGLIEIWWIRAIIFRRLKRFRVLLSRNHFLSRDLMSTCPCPFVITETRTISPRSPRRIAVAAAANGDQLSQKGGAQVSLYLSRYAHLSLVSLTCTHSLIQRVSALSSIAVLSPWRSDRLDRCAEYTDSRPVWLFGHAPLDGSGAPATSAQFRWTTIRPIRLWRHHWSRMLISLFLFPFFLFRGEGHWYRTGRECLFALTAVLQLLMDEKRRHRRHLRWRWNTPFQVEHDTGHGTMIYCLLIDFSRFSRSSGEKPEKEVLDLVKKSGVIIHRVKHWTIL